MIDWERVKDLRQEVGDTDFDEIFGVFREEVEEIMARLRTNPVPERFEEDMHFLKGSALSLGFAHFGQLCHDGERRAAEGASPALPELFRAYQASLDQFREGAGG